MHHHQVGHQLAGVVVRGDAALLQAGGDQLPQHAEVDTALVVLKDGLLRIFQAVDEAAVQGGVFGTDVQRLAHKVQQLAAGGGGVVGQVRLLQQLVLGVHVAGDLDDKLILALEVVIDIAHGAAGGLRDLLHGHIFKAVPVKQVQRHVLDAGAHLQCLPFAGGQRFFHTFSFGNFLLSYQLFYLRSRRQEGTDVDKDR